MIANDFTALSVALPAIERDLDADLTHGPVGHQRLRAGVRRAHRDRRPARRHVRARDGRSSIGAAIFAAFSVLGGAAPSVVWLIACRALMGVGGALMWPAILGMTYAILPDGQGRARGRHHPRRCGLRQRDRAAARRGLTDVLSWRWIFFVNVPIAVVRDVRDVAGGPGRARPRPSTSGSTMRGVATLSVGLVALLLALDEGSDAGAGATRGSSPSFVICVAMLVGVLPRRAPRRRRGARPARRACGNAGFARLPAWPCS